MTPRSSSTSHSVLLEELMQTRTVLRELSRTAESFTNLAMYRWPDLRADAPFAVRNAIAAARDLLAVEPIKTDHRARDLVEQIVHFVEHLREEFVSQCMPVQSVARRIREQFGECDR